MQNIIKNNICDATKLFLRIKHAMSFPARYHVGANLCVYYIKLHGETCQSAKLKKQNIILQKKKKKKLRLFSKCIKMHEASN